MEALHSQSKYENILFEFSDAIIFINVDDRDIEKQQKYNSLCEELAGQLSCLKYSSEGFYFNRKIERCLIINYVEEIRKIVSLLSNNNIPWMSNNTSLTFFNQNTGIYGLGIITKDDIIFLHNDNDGTIFKEIYPLIKTKVV